MLRPMHGILQSQNGSTNNNRRTFAITLVAGLHVLLFWGLANGIASYLIADAGDITFVPIDKPKAIIDPEIVPRPTLVQPSGGKVVAPRPTWETESESVISADPMPPLGSTQQSGNVIPDAGPLAANARTIPPYPALEARLGVEGVVTIRLAISEAGFVTAADLVKSSGSRGLDRAAVSWVMANWKYKPATHNGQPVASTTEVTVNFTLNRR